MSLLGIFATAILPIVALAVVGFVLGRRTGVPAGPLNTVTIYVLVPALVFHSLATTDLAGGTLVGIAAGVLAFTAVMVLVTETVGRGLGEVEPVLGSLVLVATFSNAGNYGIPVSEFAFGAVGRQTAVVYIVAQAVAMYTLGVYVAARGEGSSALEGIKTVFSIPLVYAVVGTLAARWLGVVPAESTAAMQTIRMLGNASIPVMLLILGIRLSNVDVAEAVGRVGVASGAKLLVAPLVGLGIALAVGFQNTTVARTFVLLTAAPTAVTPVILVGAFSGANDGPSASQFVSTSVFVTTVASVVTVTALVAALQSGLVL